MLRLLLCFAIFILAFFPANAQLGKNQESQVLYEKEWSTGPMVHTRGLGWSLQFTRYAKGDRYKLYDFSLYQLKHPKEISLSNPTRQNPNGGSFVFGKKNSLAVLKAGFGMRYILADKLTQNGVRVNFNYNLGPMLGIIKPVYYEIETTIDGRAQTLIEKFPDDEQKQKDVVDTAPFSNGLKEMGVLYGLGAKSSFSFEWGNYDYKFYSIETGVTIDAFPKDVPIFAFIDNDRLFVNLFLCFSFGNRN